MTGRNDRSATIYRRSGANQVRVRVREDHCSRGRRVYPLLKHGKGAELTSRGNGGGEGNEIAK